MAPRASRPIGTGPGRPALPPRRPGTPWVRRGLIFAICVLALNALIGERGLAETLRVRAQVRAITLEVNRLRHENDRLAEYADRLARDPRTIEDIARRELGLMRRGEILVVLKDAAPGGAPAR